MVVKQCLRRQCEPVTKAGMQVRGEPLQRLQSAPIVAAVKKIRVEAKGRKRKGEKTEPAKVAKIRKVDSVHAGADRSKKHSEKKRPKTQSGATKKAKLERQNLVFDEACEEELGEVKHFEGDDETRVTIDTSTESDVQTSCADDSVALETEVNVNRRASILRKKGAAPQESPIAFSEKSQRITFAKDSMKFIGFPKSVLTKREDGFNMWGMWRSHDIWELHSGSGRGEFDAFVDPFLQIGTGELEYQFAGRRSDTRSSLKTYDDLDLVMDNLTAHRRDMDDCASSVSSDDDILLIERWPDREDYNDDETYEADILEFERVYSIPHKSSDE